LTSVPSALVKPPRVAEAPIAMECKVQQVIKTGTEGGAGNLVICEILQLYIKEDILDAEKRIDPFKLDAVARLGGDWYARIHGSSIFKVPKPLERRGIGVDMIPEKIRRSRFLTGNDLGILGNVEKLPEADALEKFKQEPEVHQALMKGEEIVHKLAHQYLEEGRVEDAWKILLLI
jgi:hypothetical protein